MKHFLFLHLQSARQALHKILRQPFGSLLNLLMLSVALALPLSLYVGINSLQGWLGKLTASPQISLFMETSAEEADIAAVDRTLRGHPRVARYHFVSKAQALTDLEKRNALTGLAEGLEGNPLPDAFIVEPRDAEPQALEMLQKELSGLPMVESAQFDADWAKRLYSLLELGRHLTWLLAGVLGVALVLITHNTIRMQILARREEIEVSKLIGATDSFIRRPFLYHAVWQAVLATLIAWGLTEWLVAIAGPAVSQFAQLYNEHVDLHGLRPAELLGVMAVSALLAMLGARLAADHQLRQIESS
ncbi:permease-like cell division protein FtsX [Gulbenkiania mobilis]|uniref:permease-like cell division protein FtsX n=1 Tax=Gulbenkiania mobilis TaxID=397457 RepID=UPI0006BBA929|nr:permease-like cell division protein FtsX [Gulbenkiania mobilis]